MIQHVVQREFYHLKLIQNRISTRVGTLNEIQQSNAVIGSTGCLN